MNSFKIWLQLNELLAGPGGGPEPEPDDQEALAKEIAAKGAGAFKKTGEEPPKAAPTVTQSYADGRFNRKAMKKK